MYQVQHTCLFCIVLCCTCTVAKHSNLLGGLATSLAPLLGCHTPDVNTAALLRLLSLLLGVRAN